MKHAIVVYKPVLKWIVYTNYVEACRRRTELRASGLQCDVYRQTVSKQWVKL